MDKIKKNNRKNVKKGKGISKTLKKAGKIALGTIGTIGALGALADAYGNHKYDSYMSALEGRGVIDDSKKFIKKHGKKIALGALGTYGTYKALTYPFIPVGGSIEDKIGPVRGKRVKGKGIKSTLKNVGKYALPIAGALGSAYLADKYLNMGTYTPVDSSAYLENLGPDYGEIKIPDWVLDINEQLPLGRMGRGVPNLENSRGKIVPLKKDERINKIDYGKMLKYGAYGLTASALAYYAYKNNIVPNLYNKTKDFFKKDPTMIQSSDIKTDIRHNIPFDEEFEMIRREEIDSMGRRQAQNIVSDLMPTPSPEVVASAIVPEMGEAINPFSIEPSEIFNEAGEVVNTMRQSIARPLMTNTIENLQRDISKLTSSIQKDFTGRNVLTVPDLEKLAEKYDVDINFGRGRGSYTKLDGARVILDSAREMLEYRMTRMSGKGIKKGKKGKKSGKGIFLGMKNVEKYKNII